MVKNATREALMGVARDHAVSQVIVKTLAVSMRWRDIDGSEVSGNMI